jgi:hypothetical protein
MIAYATASKTMAVVMLWLFVPAVYLYIGPSFALINNLVPPQMRAQAIAIYLFTTNFANLAIAPQLIGFGSDAIAPLIGQPHESLRYTLIALATTGFWGASHFIVAARYIRGDLARVAR